MPAIPPVTQTARLNARPCSVDPPHITVYGNYRQFEVQWIYGARLERGRCPTGRSVRGSGLMTPQGVQHQGNKATNYARRQIRRDDFRGAHLSRRSPFPALTFPGLPSDGVKNGLEEQCASLPHPRSCPSSVFSRGLYARHLIRPQAQEPIPSLAAIVACERRFTNHLQSLRRISDELVQRVVVGRVAAVSVDQ